MYRVTIVKVEPVIRQKREYEKVADTGNEHDNGPVYEYVPYDEKGSEETSVYQQSVADLDLVAVINAVNKVNTQQEA